MADQLFLLIVESLGDERVALNEEEMTGRGIERRGGG